MDNVLRNARSFSISALAFWQLWQLCYGIIKWLLLLSQQLFSYWAYSGSAHRQTAAALGRGAGHQRAFFRAMRQPLRQKVIKENKNFIHIAFMLIKINVKISIISYTYYKDYYKLHKYKNIYKSLLQFSYESCIIVLSKGHDPTKGEKT